MKLPGSRVAEYVPNERLAWYTAGPAISTAYHRWSLIPVVDGCRVVSEKLDYGGNLSAASGNVHSTLNLWVHRLKALSESQPKLSLSSRN
jgi:hypothetical protein